MSYSNYQLSQRINNLQNQINIIESGGASLAGDNIFTGSNQFDQIPTTETASANDNSNKVATTEYVDTAISAIPTITPSIETVLSVGGNNAGGQSIVNLLSVECLGGNRSNTITLDTATIKYTDADYPKNRTDINSFLLQSSETTSAQLSIYDQPRLSLIDGTTSNNFEITANYLYKNGTGLEGQVLGRTTGTNYEWIDQKITNFDYQVNFEIAPHSVPPELGNDLATKGYVDSLVGQYAGGFNLFFNYSQTDITYPTFKSLSKLISSSAGEIVPTTINTGNNIIAQFITEPLGIDTIPAGLWDAFIYGAINATGGDAHYYFELWKKTALNVDTLIGTSGISPDINASPNNNPTSYSMILPISTAISLELTDRLYIVIYVNYNGSVSRNLSTYFEGSYYSFIQTSLNAGTTLLSSNNTWTGINSFSLPPTTPNQVGTPANTDIINYETITNLIDDIPVNPIVSTLQYFITTDSPFFQYPPAPPTNALIQTYQYYGWYFINSVVLRKIDWYFAPDFAMTVADVKGVYLNYLNITTTSNENLPFFTIYTKPTGSGDIIPGFAHSSATYIANFSPTAGTPYCSFMNISGTQPNPFPYGHQLGAMILSPVAPNPRGDYLPTEEVLAISVGSNSTSPINQVNFIMSKVGICLEQGNQELILNPQNIISPSVPTLGQVMTSGATASSNLNMSSYSINNVSTIDNGANKLTIGTTGQFIDILGTIQNNGSTIPSPYFSGSGVASGNVDMNGFLISNVPIIDCENTASLSIGTTNAGGVSIGRTSQITNLIGNVRVNSSSGSSGQVLTSTGSSTAPTWQTPSAGSSSLAVVKVGPTLMTQAYGAGASRFVFQNNFLNITPPSLTATYLIQCQLLCNNNVANTAFFGNLGYQVGGGAQTTSAISLFNNLAMSNVANTSFNQVNSLSQCNLSVDNTYNQLSFTFIHTPATLSLVSYAFWLGTLTGNGAATIFSMSVIRIIS